MHDVATHVHLPATDACRAACEVVATLVREGHSAYFVGGCVRDLVLGCEPKDWDVATSAHPPEVRRVFRHVVEVGVAFGVLRVRTPDGRHEVEVATFRAEAGYTDGRRPDLVRFTDAREDVLRRDFTLNGLLLDPLDPTGRPARTCEVVDFVGGLDDLRNGCLRAIGEPAARFGDDALRLLRAPRFAARFGLRIDAATAHAIAALASTLERVSAERVAAEVGLLLRAPTAPGGVALLADLGLGAVLWPELWAHDGGLEQTVARLQRLHAHTAPTGAGLVAECSVSLALAVAVLWWPLRSAAAAQRLARQWRMARAEGAELAATWAGADALDDLLRREADPVRQPLDDDGVAAVRQLRQAWADAALRALAAADPTAQDRALRWRTLRAATPPDLWRPLPFVTGDVLARHGAAPGPAFKAALEAAERAQLRGAEPQQCLEAALRELAQRAPT